MMATQFLFLFKSKYRRRRGVMVEEISTLLILLLVTLILGGCEAVSEGTGAEVVGEMGLTDLATKTVTKTPPPGCERGCINGDCEVGEEGGKCKCWEGWRGERCELCGGKVRMSDNTSRSWLAEAAGNYTINMKCTWLVETARPGGRIRLHLKDFETECGWDHLYVWDGDNVFHGLQAVYSGLVKTKSGDYQIASVPEIVGESGKMLLHFYSDVAYNMTGFNISFSVDSCPSSHYQQTCSGRGSCDQASGRCRCDADFKGSGCEKAACPDNCGNAEGRGSCNREGRLCECNDGWRGEDCRQKADVGWWEVVETAEDTKETSRLSSEETSKLSRTSHVASVTDGDMWVVGGEFLHKAPSNSMVRRWSLLERRWKNVTVMGKKAPSERYGHSAVVHNGKIFMYGGVMRSGHVSKELWSFDLTTMQWSRELVKAGKCHSGLCGEIHCAGHTATLVENRMIVIFGHSPRLGYLDTVQEYHFGSREWAIVETRGYPVKGGYGHSAVLDEVTNKIYVYGGYISQSSAVAQLSSQLYSFDHIKAEWELRTASTSARYLHTGVVHRGLMLVYGGNTHNDTQYSQGAKCYSKDFIAYDIACDQWVNLEHTIPRDFSADMDRFGHTAVMFNDSLYIYGGFNGQTKSDIISFHAGGCGHIKGEKECVSSFHGVKCVWNRKKNQCEVWGPEVKKNSVSLCSHETGPKNTTAVCSVQRSCHSCLATSQGCVWCSDGCQSNKCHQRKDVKLVNQLANCIEPAAVEVCENLHTCEGCTSLDRCWWNTEKQCREKQPHREQALVEAGGGNISQEKGEEGDEDGEEGTGSGRQGGRKEPLGHCPVSCSSRTTCANCTSGLCMWCHNQQMCVDRNAYLASFPYGQCMDWTTHFEQCPAEPPLPDDKNSTVGPTVPNLCRGYDTCSDCLTNPACGWCDGGNEEGLGRCHEGGDSGPLNRTTKIGDTRGHQWAWTESSVCDPPTKAGWGEGMGWHFTDCPACQCNGHSRCLKDSPGVCEQPCQHNTMGDHCERCSDGYFGHPVNGGECKKCECNGQGTLCDHRSGNCFCTTKGITGDHCEKCDTQNHYFGDPINSSCFYDLAIDYQFTFNLSKPEDKHYTAINFKNVPTKPDVDVDFSITCSVNAKMNLTYKHALKEGAKKEDFVLTEKNCSMFKNRFSKGEYTFGSEENTTFYVYVYDFQPPLWIIISFSQHPKLDLLQFFITFSTCFLALLLIAAILWKIKQKYDRYRRRQRLYVEMEQMASRPFGQVLTELERIPDTSDSSHHHTRKRRKKPRPSPIALEPCVGNRAAVLTLIVRMPTGGHSYAPPGLPGIAIASSLVTLGNPRKTSVDPTQKVEGDGGGGPNSKSRKNRKVVASTTLGGGGVPTDL